MRSDATRLKRVLEGELDRHLRLVGELAPLPGKELDPVVVIGVVGGADHDPGIRAVGLREIRDGRGRGRTEQPHIGPGRGQPGFERGLEHVAGDAGVLADEDEAIPVVREHPPRGPAEPQHEVGGDGMAPDPAPDSVSAEKPRLHASGAAVSVRSPDRR